MSDLPFQVEYAKSGRASCKGCKQKIDQGELRIAAMVQSAFFDGKQPNWYHENCFFQKQRPKSVNDIDKINTLRLPDQKRLKETMSGLSDVVMPKVKGKGAKRGHSESNASAIRDFKIEYSKSSRAACRVCDLKIAKGEVRIAKVVYDSEVGAKFGGQPLWHHVTCFGEARNSLLYFAGAEDLPGYKDLSKEDKAIVKKHIKSMSSDDIPLKKLKEEVKDEKEVKEEAAFNKKLEQQTKLFCKYRDALKKYSKRDIQEILEFNSQCPPGSPQEAVDHLADCMAFGVPEPCSECKNGQLVLTNSGYKCTGDLTEWTKCQHTIREPQRKALKIPKEFKQSSAFSKYKAKVAVRLFSAPIMPSVVFLKPEKSDEPVKKEVVAPLRNLRFFLYGKLKQSKDDLKMAIVKMGGSVISKLDNMVAAVISTKAEVERMSNKMLEIEEMDIEVIDENFLTLIDKKSGTVATTLQLIKDHNIATWGSDPTKRLPQDVVDGKSKSSSSIYSKSKSAPTKLKLKGGTAVDPDSGLADTAHVYKDENGVKFTVVLGQTDVVAQKNSYYKLQVLQDDDMKRSYLFRSWGRIGTKIGGNKLEKCLSISDAIVKFENHYMEKTENPWECRDYFEKVPGCYYPIDVDYGDDNAKVALLEDKSSKLPPSVQKFIIKIFDVKAMQQTLLEFELDTEKMPLGKLSKKQIKAGYKVLSELINLLQSGNASNNKIIDATNRFYTLVPHNFGTQNPPLLNDMEVIKTKTLMMDNLLEIEIAYSLMNPEESSQPAQTPIDAHYLKLKCEIKPIDRMSPEFEIIQKYVRNTHAATHSQYTLDIEEVFQVVRDGEEKRYKPFRKLHNKRLLWHGSRITNFAGILSQGLRIAPPEAPVTGYMFGKGVYFSDMVSKSANYCCTSKTNSTGVLLLCEVALGDMKECKQAESITKLPAGKHSVWGLGQTMPDPDQNHTLENGTIVPLGTPKTRTINTSLLYNEFIVYDIAQVNLKYLLQMKFNYKF